MTQKDEALNKSEEQKKVLILTADAGFGHRSAANAVEAAFLERYGDVCRPIMVNPLEDKRTPFFLRDSQSDYDQIVREMPELYRFGYDASDAALPSTIVESALTVLLFEVLRDIVIQHKPDAILTTYPLYQAPLVALMLLRRQNIPLITVVTDLVTVHRLWFVKTGDTFLVPTVQVQQLAQEYGIDEKNIQVTGIPVNPSITREKRSRQEIRRSLGWDEELDTFLVVGSRRVDQQQLLDTLAVLNHYGRPLQLAVVAGKDHDMYQKICDIEWHVPVHLYEYTGEMMSMMQAADVLVSKAGGLIVTEALANGLPMLLVDIIPGQETGNAAYVVEGGAGERSTHPLQTLEIVNHWLKDDRKLLIQRAEKARSLGCPMAAYQAADVLWQAAQRGVTERHWKITSEINNLIEMLAKFDIGIKDSPIFNLPAERKSSAKSKSQDG